MTSWGRVWRAPCGGPSLEEDRRGGDARGLSACRTRVLSSRSATAREGASETCQGESEEKAKPDGGWATKSEPITRPRPRALSGIPCAPGRRSPLPAAGKTQALRSLPVSVPRQFQNAGLAFGDTGRPKVGHVGVHTGMRLDVAPGLRHDRRRKSETAMPVELHAASAFSFLRASSLPEDLVERAAELGYRPSPSSTATASRAPRASSRRRARAGMRPLVGAELSLDGRGRAAAARRDAAGYRNLCRLITRMKAGVPKGEGRLPPRDAGGPRRGAGRAAGGRDAGRRRRRRGPTALDTDRLARLVEAFGPGRVVLDVQRHRRREEEAANQALLDLADALGLRAVATNGVRHATPEGPGAPRRAHLHPREADARRPPGACWPRTPSAT